MNVKFCYESHLEASIIATVKRVAPHIYREEKQLSGKQHADLMFIRLCIIVTTEG